MAKDFWAGLGRGNADPDDHEPDTDDEATMMTMPTWINKVDLLSSDQVRDRCDCLLQAESAHLGMNLDQPRHKIRLPIAYPPKRQAPNGPRDTTEATDGNRG